MILTLRTMLKIHCTTDLEYLFEEMKLRLVSVEPLIPFEEMKLRLVSVEPLIPFEEMKLRLVSV